MDEFGDFISLSESSQPVTGDLDISNCETNGNSSLNMFPESPVYEPEDLDDVGLKNQDVMSIPDQLSRDTGAVAKEIIPHNLQAKRKLSDEGETNTTKLQKLDVDSQNTQTLDDEVSSITNLSKFLEGNPLPSTSRVRTPVRSSPRKITKRSNSTVVSRPKTPKTPRSRPASVDTTRQRKTPKKLQEISLAKFSQSEPSPKTFEPITEEPKVTKKPCELIAEENSELNDSQNIHLVLSPTPDEDSEKAEQEKVKYSSDPVLPRDRIEVLHPGKVGHTPSVGYGYSDQSSNLTQPRPKDFGLGTDQESTDSVCSMSIDSPEAMPMAASKHISKLSNGNSSTPTEVSTGKMHGSMSDSDATPDMLKLNGNKGKNEKLDSFRVSNSTTPSTISPLQNGHSLPMNTNTPAVPVFDIHVNHTEDGEFLSLYIVRSDNDLGQDMHKEYQRFSKRFTIDPYLADVSSGNSPSSVTSGGMVNLPTRTSFASTVSSTSSSSNRTSDGNFVVPQPPRKSVSHPSTTIRGCDALMKKLQDVFSHIRDTSMVDCNRSIDEKISIGVQASDNLSNGNASPQEVAKLDKATPKSSLKKTRVRGRRPLAGKTKRALLPTQTEEPEYMHGMNSPEMLPIAPEGNLSPKSKEDNKPLSSLVGTPKSVTKLKRKGRPTSPRPATPIDKPVKQEYPGYPPETVVLAKWVDKRYYSGRVIEITEPSKYLIKFDDGQTKALLDDFIIFGDMRFLPLQGQSVYAMVDEEQNYEPGLVLTVEENDGGTIVYNCTTDHDVTVCVTASELYLTEDQARSIKDSVRSKSPGSAPTTPRRRGLRELDLDNIIQGPRSARSRDKGPSSARKRHPSPRSPKASTSAGLKTKSTPLGRSRLCSESSSVSECSSNPPPARLEEVPGVEPELQKTPRKIDGLRAGPLHLKGAAKQNIGKKNSKLTKFENDEDTISQLGPIPPADSKIFEGLHFLLTCTEPPKRTNAPSKHHEARQYSSEEDGESSSTAAGTDTEDLVFCDRPFNKERLKDQLEAGGGVVYSHFDEVPKAQYAACHLIAPRPCLTAKYITCLAVGARALTHGWVVASCAAGRALDADAFLLPAGWALRGRRFVNWNPPSGKRNTAFFKDRVILLCGDQDTFVKFWERVCTLAGGVTRVVNEEDLNMTGAVALVTEWDCPHEVQNKANQDNIPLVSTTWVVQCLIEGRWVPPTAHDKFSFMYAEPE